MAHRLSPADAPEFMRDGIVARQSGNRLAAVRYFKAAVAADPKGRQARIELAQELAALGHHDAGEAVLRRVLGRRATRKRNGSGSGSDVDGGAQRLAAA
ncbi:tetratricopeptide repeat protein [Siccirubricoccus sp. G192]|uniref:tetratricopeptide repeat protein n=1 Tax=Siccirubricoccus sp. G192 TaxID=2849651 RepID=UPI001C2B7FA1|nr:tetratricopeptide repeat protein [Siccirubricoccus sp. G192]MBV1796506.1 hypothetical protein [Siccirubricoccus sp. G192]